MTKKSVDHTTQNFFTILLGLVFIRTKQNGGERYERLFPSFDACISDLLGDSDLFKKVQDTKHFILNEDNTVTVSSMGAALWMHRSSAMQNDIFRVLPVDLMFGSRDSNRTSLDDKIDFHAETLYALAKHINPSNENGVVPTTEQLERMNKIVNSFNNDLINMFLTPVVEDDSSTEEE